MEFFYFICSITERILIKGEMVSSFEFEKGSLSYLEIEDAVSIGIPSKIEEEDIHLFVTLKPSSCLTEYMIRTHCQAVMARFMVSKVITILDDISRTTAGKHENRKLAAISLNTYGLSRSFGGKYGGKSLNKLKLLNDINISGGRHFHLPNIFSCFKLSHNFSPVICLRLHKILTFLFSSS